MESDWRRRHAIQIAAQLPESIDDALIVLEFTREIVESFLAKQLHELPERRLAVLSSVGGSKR